ncbi:LOW QUALITY PROTEIN: signal recognition particle receptor subunit beta-like, partial [Dioscorea cayenensis subsp. rotundata]|uniref:Signal recognition particle receptor subunit beta n=1 Tax=Dioscorea cayennensis subsp. rotundata TaxID=55577 RepID=A0AB40ANY6_DIOCR
CLFITDCILNRGQRITIELTGLSGGGKIILFYELRDGTPHHGTVTSMEPNRGTFVLHSELEKKDKIKPIHLVDVPGHSRLRPILDDFLAQVAGIIFVVDAVEFLPKCRATAEYLYDILTKSTVIKRKVSILILCNNTDKITAHSKEFIQKQLEKEINKLRASRTAVSSAYVTNEYTLGLPLEVFSFSQCHKKVVVFQVEQFIREQVKPRRA